MRFGTKKSYLLFQELSLSTTTISIFFAIKALILGIIRGLLHAEKSKRLEYDKDSKHNSLETIFLLRKRERKVFFLHFAVMIAFSVLLCWRRFLPSFLPSFLCRCCCTFLGEERRREHRFICLFQGTAETGRHGQNGTLHSLSLLTHDEQAIVIHSTLNMLLLPSKTVFENKRQKLLHLPYKCD